MGPPFVLLAQILAKVALALARAASLLARRVKDIRNTVGRPLRSSLQQPLHEASRQQRRQFIGVVAEEGRNQGVHSDSAQKLVC